MSDAPNEQASPKEAAELEKALKARFHRQMGMAATLFVLLAVVVALARIKKMFPGYSVWTALGIGASGVPWILIILGVGVVVSMSATRIILGVERITRLAKKRTHTK